LWLDPEDEDPRLGDVVFALRYKPLVACEIAKNGALILDFGPALTIDVPQDDRYEAWTLDHKSFKIIAETGNAPAI
jgi:hypothetical protein